MECTRTYSESPKLQLLLEEVREYFLEDLTWIGELFTMEEKVVYSGAVESGSMNATERLSPAVFSQLFLRNTRQRFAKHKRNTHPPTHLPCKKHHGGSPLPRTSSPKTTRATAATGGSPAGNPKTSAADCRSKQLCPFFGFLVFVIIFIGCRSLASVVYTTSVYYLPRLLSTDATSRLP